MTRSLVWDTTGVLHASKAGCADVLGAHTAGPSDDPWVNVTTSIVQHELDEHGFVVPPWLSVVAESVDEISTLGTWIDRVGSSQLRHLGEATVLNIADSRNFTAIVDDADAKSVGEKFDVETHGTLWVIAQQVNRGECAAITASNFADLLKENGMRVPFLKGEYLTWARQRGVIEKGR